MAAFRTANGALEYLAPEIIEEQEVSCAADLWSLGALTYELLVGCNPFVGETEEETKRNIMRGSSAPRLARLRPGRAVSKVALDFIFKLLKRVPRQRLGAKNFADLTGHEFLADVNIETLKKELFGGRHRGMTRRATMSGT